MFLYLCFVHICMDAVGIKEFSRFSRSVSMEGLWERKLEPAQHQPGSDIFTGRGGTGRALLILAGQRAPAGPRDLGGACGCGPVLLTYVSLSCLGINGEK